MWWGLVIQRVAGMTVHRDIVVWWGLVIQRVAGMTVDRENLRRFIASRYGIKPGGRAGRLLIRAMEMGFKNLGF